MFNSEIYKARRAKLLSGLKSGLVLIPGNNEMPYSYRANSFPFRQDSTFLYFAGIDYPSLVLVLDCDNSKEYLFGNSATEEDAIWSGKQPSIEEYAALSGIENVKPFDSLEKFVKDYKGKVHFINPYSGDIQVLVSTITGIDVNQLKEKQSLEMISVVSNMRKIKEDVEIQEIENAVNLTGAMFEYIMKYSSSVEEYFSEKDVAGKIYDYCLTKGYYPAFKPIVTIHGEILHNFGYKENLKKGRLLLVDAGLETSSHYGGDMTRTIPLGGKFSKRQRDVYDIVVKANWGIVDSARPGVAWSKLHNRAARIITSGLKDLGIMKGDTDDIVANGAYALFFPHGLGHLLGLDTHDMENYGEDLIGYDDTIKRSEIFGPSSLRYGLEIKENMVLTNEPGIYFIPHLIESWQKEGKFKDFINYDRALSYKDFGGIRIEDDLLITANGCRLLGKPVAKTGKEIEAAISGK
ncbi:MAG: aminopeptidase P N-terminal domain-containing protein [Bacteroidales bacterium]|nr:aminopeptidase P N-terminal domain-containing protein [Bacteroidales bacterium]